jgi:hypothetical protein
MAEFFCIVPRLMLPLWSKTNSMLHAALGVPQAINVRTTVKLHRSVQEMQTLFCQ